jgi:hypothetical protein
MVNLTDDNDPLLFCADVPAGRLVVQYMEVLASVQAAITPGTEPTLTQVATYMREASRTPEVAKNSSDAVLIALWHRMTAAMAKQGNA